MLTPSYNNSCSHMASGNDEMFTVSGIFGFGK